MKEKKPKLPTDIPQRANETLKDRYDSRDLFRGHQEIMIEHVGDVYRLRITRQGKLILTK